MNRPRHTSANIPSRANSKVRTFITPEGIALNLQIASASLRIMALIIDLFILVLVLIGLTIFAIWIGADGETSMASVIWLLGFFLLRTFWFTGFEMGKRSATPGKRIVGIRVVARDGGRLTGGAILARNLIRELEIFLPFYFLGMEGAGDRVGAWTSIAGVIWSLILGLFLLFNRDRMRMGDLIAGTWVVMAVRKKLVNDLGATRRVLVEEPHFSDSELAVYGVFELQELERILRKKDRKVMHQAAESIRRKIARAGHKRVGHEKDDIFLMAYYRQFRHRLENRLLIGERRENKYDVEQGG